MAYTALCIASRNKKNELAEIGLFDMYIASDHGNSYPVIVMGKLKPQSNGSLYSNTVIVNWSLMGGLLHLVQQGGAWAGCGPVQSPPRCTKCNSPPINGQSFDVALHRVQKKTPTFVFLHNSLIK